MDRIEAMRIFVRVAERGSFAAVARQADVARSAITRQIAALEKHLGVRLLSRSTRRLALTAAGDAYLVRCREILALVDAAESGVANERAVPEGRLRVGLPLGFGVHRLAPLLLGFAAAHPRVQLELDFSDRRLDLVEQGYDLAIRVTTRLSPDTVARKLGSARMVVVASPAYLAKAGRPTHPSQLVTHAALTYQGEESRHAWRFTSGGEVTAFPVTSRFCASDGEVLARAAAAGLGIARLPDFLVRDGLASGALEAVLDRFASPPLGIHALLPGRGPVPLRVRLLLEHIAAGLAAERSRPSRRPVRSRATRSRGRAQ